MTQRGTDAHRGWAVVLILVAIAALFVAYVEWWNQANGQGVLESLLPEGANIVPGGWEQERLRSQVLMVLALLVAGSSGLGAFLLIKRRKPQHSDSV